MSAQVTVTDPFWTFDALEFEKQIATFTKNNAIATETGYLAAVTAITAPQVTLAVQAMLRCVKCSVP